VLLRKKRGLSLARKWRGIYLPDIVFRVLSSIMVRIKALMEQVSSEIQAG